MIGPLETVVNSGRLRRISKNGCLEADRHICPLLHASTFSSFIIDFGLSTESTLRPKKSLRARQRLAASGDAIRSNGTFAGML